MNIPDEAIEVAARAHYRPTGDIAVDADEWATCCRDALAAAWQEGVDAEADRAKWDSIGPNPYRADAR